MPDVLDLPTSTEPSTDAQPTLNSVNNTKRTKPPKTDKAIVETAKALYFQGNSLKSIATQLNLNPSTVRFWSFNQRWPELAGKAKQLTQLSQVKMSVNVNVASPAASEQSARVRNALGAAVESQAIALAASETRLEDLPNTPARQGQAAVLKTIADAASTIFDWDSQHTPGIIVIGDVEGREPESTPIDVQSSVAQVTEGADTTTGSVPS
jgi:hypothetical protein